LWEQFIYSPSVQLEKLSQTHPQATVSRWNFFHPIATRIRLPQWYEKNILRSPCFVLEMTKVEYSDRGRADYYGDDFPDDYPELLQEALSKFKKGASLAW
jgi:hypothetical protein